MKGLIITALLCAAIAEASLSINSINPTEPQKTAYEAVVNADVIELRYRYHNGKSQYRHYNVTRGRWVEKDWVDVPNK